MNCYTCRATGAAWPIVGMKVGALILNGLCWHEVEVIPVEFGAVWEDEVQQKTVPLLSTDTTGSLVGKIWVAREMYVLIGAFNRCGATVVTVLIGCKVGSTCNGTAWKGIERQFLTNLLEFTKETSNGGGAIAVLSNPDVTAGMLRPIPAAHDCCWKKGVGSRSRSSKLALIITPSGLTSDEIPMGVGCLEAHALGSASATISWLWFRFSITEPLCTQSVTLWDSDRRLAAINWDKVSFNSFSSELSDRSSV